MKPKDSPVEPFGFSLTLFVIAVGGVLLWAFVRWQHHREANGQDPLVHLDLLKIPPLRSGLIGLFSQNLILMGVFFIDPALPAARPRPRRARDRHQDAAGLDHDVPRLGSRVAAVDAVPGPHDRPGRALDHASSPPSA